MKDPSAVFGLRKWLRDEGDDIDVKQVLVFMFISRAWTVGNEIAISTYMTD